MTRLSTTKRKERSRRRAVKTLYRQFRAEMAFLRMIARDLMRTPLRVVDREGRPAKPGSLRDLQRQMEL